MNFRSRYRPASTADTPFAVPPVVVLDLPAPPSVNRTRKIDPRSIRRSNEWAQIADNLVMAQRRPGQSRHVPGRFEILITISEAHSGLDLDNGIKATIDYLRRIEVIEDDSPKFLRKLTVEFGEAPEGCRVHVRGIA